MDEPHITDHLHAWRVASLGDREVIEGILPSDGVVQEDELRRALATWDADGMHYTDEFGGARWLVLAREQAARANAGGCTRCCSRSRWRR